MTFDKSKATLIGTVCGIAFYEHPTRGDEAGMIAVYKGEALHTDWYDLPESNDIYPGAADFMETYRA